jgi:hypothetical protein
MPQRARKLPRPQAGARRARPFFFIWRQCPAHADFATRALHRMRITTLGPPPEAPRFATASPRLNGQTMDWKMQKLFHALWALPLMLLAPLAQAQTAGTLNLSVNKSSATGSATPVLTWSTTPVASSCSASGGWSGTKFGSGSETVAKITKTTSYSMTCTWRNGTAVVRWTAPTRNTDGTALTDLAGFKIVYGVAPSALTHSQVVNDPKAASATVTALSAGTWYFAVRAVNKSGTESSDSSTAQKAVDGAYATRTVKVSISGGTTTPTLKTTSTAVYDVITRYGRRSLGRQVGTIAIGKPCQSSYQVGSNYFRVTTSDVKQTRTPRSSSLVARCAIS